MRTFNVCVHMNIYKVNYQKYCIFTVDTWCVWCIFKLYFLLSLTIILTLCVSDTCFAAAILLLICRRFVMSQYKTSAYSLWFWANLRKIVTGPVSMLTRHWQEWSIIIIMYGWTFYSCNLWSWALRLTHLQVQLVQLYSRDGMSLCSHVHSRGHVHMTVYVDDALRTHVHLATKSWWFIIENREIEGEIMIFFYFLKFDSLYMIVW